ncbi:hypothetical protein JCM8547_000428 [Rhodosporidiobolus lusitaniae]
MVAPECLWAQRSSANDAARNVIYLTINAPELDPSYTLDVDGTKLSFSGKTAALDSKTAHVDGKEYAFELELFGEVEEVKRNLSGKSLKVVLQKKDLKEEYWPRLTKEKQRLNWLKTDFALWRDEDEQDDVAEDEAADFGGPGGPGGMPPMGGAGMGGAGGMDFASMMQGMGGMGGMGGEGGGMDFAKMMEQMKASGLGGAGGDFGDAPDFGAAGEGEEEDSDDDGPPPLEEA